MATTVIAYAISNKNNEFIGLLTTKATDKTVTARLNIQGFETMARAGGGNYSLERHAISYAAWKLSEQQKNIQWRKPAEVNHVLEILMREGWDQIALLERNGYKYSAMKI